jgi:RNA polymerase sigma-70 factor (ECF subfamily)
MSKSPASPTLTEDLTDLRAALLRTALVLTHNRADAEDLVQIALMRAFDRAQNQPSHTNWAAWLRTVVRHLAVDLARRKHRWRTTEWSDAVEMARGAGTEAIEPELPSVSAEQLQAAVASIDDHYQIVYRLYHVEGASYAQVAAALNIPVRTVGTRLHRARGRIRESLLQHLDRAPCRTRPETAVA